MKNTKAVLMYCLMFTSFFTFASDVYIETHNEEGQGILRSIGSECLVYTPAHVVARASDFLVSTRLEKRIKAQLITTYPQDLALLKLPSADVSACNESSWKDEGDRVNTILEVVDKGELQVRLNNGRLVTYNIYIIDKELHSFFTVRLNHPTKKISKGMSGGIVTVGNYPIGMLLSVEDDLGKVLRMDTIADASRSVVKSYATDKELIALNMDSAKPILTAAPELKTIAAATTPAVVNTSGKQIFKGRIAPGASETFPILSRGNTAYRLHSKKQSDGVMLNLRYQNSAKKNLMSKSRQKTDSEFLWEFGTTDRGEHFLVVEGYKGSGSYEFELEVIATPEQQLSESNVLGHGDTVKGMIGPGTYAIYKILSRGNTAYRLHSKKQSDGVMLNLRYQNSAKKNLMSKSRQKTDSEFLWEFGTTDRGEHFLVVEGYKGSGSYEFELEVIKD
ncbi:MAG: hypothetical protein KKF27_05430 [Gammaproteobacteria bacterium]|nr:hypothetical protein [Gammaproteobacteria bacterium]